MLHYYLQKGITPEYLLSRSLSEKLFYRASMDIAMEEKGGEVAALFASLFGAK